jgi:hypothetical protein
MDVPIQTDQVVFTRSITRRIAKLFVPSAALIVGHRVAMKRRGNDLLLGRILGKDHLPFAPQ